MSERPRLRYTRMPLALRRWLPLIVGLAVGIRVALGWMHPFEQPDSKDYVALAHALVAHQPYMAGGMIASRMPGYPIFLAAVFWLGGSVKTAMVLQGLMGGAIVVLAYLIGCRISQAAGVLAAGLAALDPLSIGFSAAVLTEIPFTLCLMAALWLCLRIMEAPGVAWRTWLVLGLVWGIGVYLRASALWAIVPLSLLAAWRWRVQVPRMRMLAAAIPLVMTVALLMPWLLRNYGHFHSGFFRLTTLEGISLYEAVYPLADGGPKQDRIALPDAMKGLDEAQINDEWSRRGWLYVTREPARMVRLAAAKIWRTWSPWFNAADFQSRPLQLAMTLWNVPLFLLALLGVARMPRRLALLLAIPLAYYTAVHALFLGSVRYRVPLMPIVCLLAAQGILFLFNWMRRVQRLPS